MLRLGEGNIMAMIKFKEFTPSGDCRSHDKRIIVYAIFLERRYPTTFNDRIDKYFFVTHTIAKPT